MTEKKKMIAGEYYDAMDKELLMERERAHDLCYELRMLLPSLVEEKKRILGRLLPNAHADIFITPPFFFDYGWNITLGEGFYCNTDCVILDCAPVLIGAHVLLGPHTQIYTPLHALNPDERPEKEFARPVRIKDNVWIGGAAVICPGVTIGKGSVIGAGSVVTRDVPDRCLAVGNPCKVIKRL